MTTMDIIDQTQALEVDETVADSDGTTTIVNSPDDKNKPVATLKVLAQKGYQEKLYPIRRGENVLGRSIDTCQIHIPTKVLSKRHAVFEVEADTHCVYDADSHNKSFKGRLCLKPYVRYELRDGDTLKFADVLCQYYTAYKAPTNVCGGSDTGSETDTAVLVTDPSTTFRRPCLSLSKKVKLAPNVLEPEISSKCDVQTPAPKELELKSDSDDDANEIEQVARSSEKILVPETPFTPQKAKLVLSRTSYSPSTSPTIISETDSDTEIEDDSEKVAETIKASGTTTKSDNPTEEPEIDWENMKTQMFAMDENDDILNADTQVVSVLPESKKADTFPPEEVSVTQAATSKIHDKGDGVKPVVHFVSQSSDGEMQAVQEAVATAIQSTALSSDSPASGAPDAGKVSAVNSDETIVPCGVRLEVHSSESSTPNSNTANASEIVVNADPVEEPCTPKQKKHRRKWASKKTNSAASLSSGVQPEPHLRPNEVPETKAASSDSKKEAKDLPDPVALNTSLPSSPKTYSRRSQDRSKLGGEADIEPKYESVILKNAVVEIPFFESKSAKMPTAKESPASRRKKKDTALNVPAERNEQTCAPSLRITLGVSPTCELLCPTSTTRNVAPVTIPSSANTRFRRVAASTAASTSPPLNTATGTAVDTLKSSEDISSKMRNKKPAKLAEVSDVEVSPATPTLRRTLRSAMVPSVTLAEKIEKTPKKEPVLSKLLTPSQRRRGRATVAEDKVGEDAITETVVATRQSRSKRRIVDSSTQDEKNNAGAFELPSVDQSKTPSLRSAKRSRSGSSTTNDETLNTSRTRGAVAEETLDTEEIVIKKGRGGRAASKRESTPKESLEDSVSAAKNSLGTQQGVTRKGRNGRAVPKRRLASKESLEDNVVVSEDIDTAEQIVARKGGRGRATSKRQFTLKDSLDQGERSAVEPPIKKLRTPRGNSKASPQVKKSAAASVDTAVVVDAYTDSDNSNTKDQPKVMFTGLCDLKLEKTISDLGGQLVDSVFQCTHLVTDKIRRTVKLLCVLARGQPIVAVKWIAQCKKAKTFIDSSPFVIVDKASERQYGFVLKESLLKAKQNGLLEGFSVHVTASVMPDPEEMKLIIECARGKYLRDMPKTVKDGDRSTVIISCPMDAIFCVSAIRAKIPVVTAEFILTGVLRQEVDVAATSLAEAKIGLETFRLSDNGPSYKLLLDLVDPGRNEEKLDRNARCRYLCRQIARSLQCGVSSGRDSKFAIFDLVSISCW